MTNSGISNAVLVQKIATLNSKINHCYNELEEVKALVNGVSSEKLRIQTKSLALEVDKLIKRVDDLKDGISTYVQVIPGHFMFKNVVEQKADSGTGSCATQFHILTNVSSQGGGMGIYSNLDFETNELNVASLLYDVVNQKTIIKFNSKINVEFQVIADTFPYSFDTLTCDYNPAISGNSVLGSCLYNCIGEFLENKSGFLLDEANETNYYYLGSIPISKIKLEWNTEPTGTGYHFHIRLVAGKSESTKYTFDVC